MDRMLFNSDATKLLSELQYLNQNQNQNQSRNTGILEVTQVTLDLTVTQTRLIRFLSYYDGLNVSFGVLKEHYSYREKGLRNKRTIEVLPSYFENSKQTNTSKNADSNRRLVQCLCDGQL